MSAPHTLKIFSVIGARGAGTTYFTTRKLIPKNTLAASTATWALTTFDGMGANVLHLITNMDIESM